MMDIMKKKYIIKHVSASSYCISVEDGTLAGIPRLDGHAWQFKVCDASELLPSIKIIYDISMWAQWNGSVSTMQNIYTSIIVIKFHASQKISCIFFYKFNAV